MEKGIKRRLTPGEISTASRVFNGAVNFRKIRIHDNPAENNDPNNPHTVGNDIHFPKNDFRDDFFGAPLHKFSTLIHEMAHVWQNQSGQRATLSHRKFRNSYKRELKESLKNHVTPKSLAELKEQLSKLRRFKKNRLVMDAVSRPLHATREIVPQPMAVEMSAEMIDNHTVTNVLPGAPIESPLDIYFREYVTDDDQDLRQKVGKYWQLISDYHYLTHDWENTAFNALSREGQAEMIKDYFILLCGGDPLEPVFCPNDTYTPTSGHERPPLSFYKRLIPFVH